MDSYIRLAGVKEPRRPHLATVYTITVKYHIPLTLDLIRIYSLLLGVWRLGGSIPLTATRLLVDIELMGTTNRKQYYIARKTGVYKWNLRGQNTTTP